MPHASRKLQISISSAVMAASLYAFFLRESSCKAPAKALSLSQSRQKLIEVLGPCRPFEARLTGSPWYPLDKGTDSCASAAARPLISRYRKTLIRDRHSLANAEYGFLEAIYGRTEKAIEYLEEALSHEPQNVAIMTDLSAAYIECAREDKDLISLLFAFNLADKAARIEPVTPAALFNLALVLEKLGLPAEARRAWLYYLKIETDLGWRNEGQGRFNELLRPSPGGQWQERRQDLLLAAEKEDLVAVREIVRQFFRQSRVLVEEALLPDWAALISKGEFEQADRSFEILQRIIGESSLVKADSFLSDVTKHIESLRLSNPASLRSLARGLSIYRTGKELYARGDYEGASSYLEVSRELVAEARSPFLPRVVFSLACADHYRSRYQDALANLSWVRDLTRRKGYEALYGESFWMGGLTHLAMGEPGRAEQSYLDALDAFSRAGDLESIAGVENLLSELLEEQGASWEAWRHRQKALGFAASIRDSQRLYQLYSLLAVGASRQGQKTLALYYQDAAVESAHSLGNPLALGNSLFWRSRFLHNLGTDREAVRDLSRARQAAAELALGPEKERLLSEILLMEAEIAGASKPLESLHLLSSSILHAKAVSKHFDNKLDLYVARSRLYAKMGDVDAAERDLARGLEILESLRARITDQDYRRDFLDKEREAYDEMVRLQFLLKKDPLSALRYSEKSRSRVLSESRSDSRSSFPGIYASPPSGGIVIICSYLRDDLFVWLLNPHGLMKAVRIPAGDRLEQMLLRQESGAALASDPQMLRWLGGLYEIILGPIRPYLPSGSSLTFICDGKLQRIPFAGLYNSRSGRFLIEDFEVSVAPALASYLKALRSLNQGRASLGGSLLIVSSPTVDRRSYPGLTSLADTLPEKGAYQDLSGGRPLRVLAGKDATKARVLEELAKSSILIFSGHAVARRDLPLESKIILAPDTVGETGRSSTLSAREIYGLRLTKQRLVVLNSCATADGHLSRSEGVEGLGRAFFASGVPGVVETLWDINDQLANTFMGSFLKRILSGDSPARALRAAQIEAIRQVESGGVKPVRVWAAFRLMGV